MSAGSLNWRSTLPEDETHGGAGRFKRFCPRGHRRQGPRRRNVDSFLIVIGLVEFFLLFGMGSEFASHTLHARTALYMTAFLVWFPVFKVIRRSSSVPRVAGQSTSTGKTLANQSVALQRSRTKTSRTLEVRLPENITVTYRLASLRERVQAFVLDLFNLGIRILLPLTVLGSIAGTLLPVRVTIILLVSLWSLLPILYFVRGETRSDGQTFGKRLMGIRVIHRSGRSVHLNEVIIRNILRLYSLIPLFIPLELFSVRSAGLGQRLGDLAADTLVVAD